MAVHRGVRLLAATALAAWAAIAVTAAAAGSRPSDAALLARYAPLLVLHPLERFQPSPVGPFVAGSDLLVRAPDGTWTPQPGPLPVAPTTGSFRLDVRGCSPAAALDAIDCYAALGGRPTAYAAVHRRSGRTVLQYWLFYAYNIWSPLVPPSSQFWQAHEGDWEEVSVLLSPAGKPLQVACSQHNLGVTRTWSRVRLKNGTHPYVYIALGSHANYFLPGYHGLASVPHVIPRRFSGLPILEPDHTSAQAPVVPAIVDVSSGTTPWLSFAGAWGDGNFVLLAGKSGFVHLRVGDSPPGPAFHDVWRDPMLQFRAWPADDGH